MCAERLLSRLERVRKTGSGRWLACCPAHDDKSPSLSIRELEDGRILLHDFGAGCSAHEIVSAAGLTLSDLFPDRPQLHTKGERRPFPAVDVLRAVAYEALIVVSCSRLMLLGGQLTKHDHERLVLAASRIQSAMTAAGVTHEH